MDPSMQQQQQPQYYYAPGAPTGSTMPPGYYAAPAPQTGAGDSASGQPPNGYVLPMAPQHAQMMFYTPAPPPGAYPTPTYAYAPMYCQPNDAAFAAMSLSGQTILPMAQPPQLQPQQTPGASSTTSNGSQPRAASTPIPAEEPASLGCNPTMVPMQVMYAQMPQYYQMPSGYEGQQMMPVVYQDPATGQYIQHMQPMQQHQQQQYPMNRMMSTDPDAIPENIDDISQISHQSSPESFMEQTQMVSGQQRNPTTPVSSQMRRRMSLPGNQNSIPNLLPSNYKTRMCTQWLEKRECSMNSNCKFAHGNAELRLPERPFRAINNPKYKTKMCKNFEPGASGLCAYAERCEYIHPTDREFAAYKSRIEALARSRREFTSVKQMFDAVPRGRAAHHSTKGGAAAADDSAEVKSARSSADSSYASAGASPPPPRTRRTSARESGYLGSAMPPSMTRSAIRMGAGADAPYQQMRRGFAGGSMYNLASGAYTDRDEYRTRLARVPSATNVASLGLGGGGGHRGAGGGKYGYSHAPPPGLMKTNRRASMCHLNTAAEY